MSKVIRAGAYFLFVGELGEKVQDENTTFGFQMPYVEGAQLVSMGFGMDKIYNWSKNSFIVHNPSTFPGKSNIKNPDYFGNLESTIKASPKEWNEKWSSIFSPENQSKLGARVVLDNKFGVVLAEIFNKDTGIPVLKWAPPGIDIERLSAQIYDTPAKDYNFDICEDLNPSYYSTSGKVGAAAVDSKIGNFFNSIFHQ